MLKLHDFLHLPELDPLIQAIVTDAPGLYILAGIDTRSMPAQDSQDAFMPSGLSAIFNILMQEILTAHPLAQAVVVSEDRALARVPRKFSRRVRWVPVDPQVSYAEQIDAAARQRPGLLIIDRVGSESAQAVFRAARSGLRVVARQDTILSGAGVARHFLDAGVPRAQLSVLRWIITMQRFPVLCNHCKKPVGDPQMWIDHIGQKYPHLVPAVQKFNSAQAGLFRAGGCDHCHQTGYSGDLSIFDLFHNEAGPEGFFQQSSQLSMEEYALRLALQGQVDLDDLLNLEGEHLRRVYGLLTASERALTQSNTALNRKVLELEASNRVLVQRTEVLVSLQDLNQALITSTELHDLSARICRRAGDLCGADYVVLYLRGADETSGTAEVLAVRGWSPSAIGQKLPVDAVCTDKPETTITRYMQTPPGVQPVWSAQGETSTGVTIKMGARVPLVAQDQPVGVMIIQSTLREMYTPGEMALLQTIANQAALAIQRASLVEKLRAKIDQLEAAQAELVKKERVDRELELAREVQQSMLPQHFPEIPGYAFSAKNEPARQVGGDFYDVIRLDENHFGVVIADVADKGMPAALYMALSRSLLVAEARRELSPRRVLCNVNRLLLELGELDGFVSVFYGVIELPTRRMTYTRAGHERPLLLRQNQMTALNGDGLVLGILEEIEQNLTEEIVDLMPGDRLVLFTDGMIDVADESGRFMGHEKLERILKDHSSVSEADLCEAVFSELARYRGGADPFDDTTLLICGVL